MYAYCLNRTPKYTDAGLRVTRGVVLYICKDNSKEKEPMVDVDESHLAGLLWEIRQANAWKAGDAATRKPPRRRVCVAPGQGAAKTCPVAGECFGG